MRSKHASHGRRIASPGAAKAKTKYVQAALAAAASGGPPPGWAPTAESPTWADLRVLAERVFELLGGPEGAAKKLNGRSYYALTLLASMDPKDRARNAPIFGAKRVKLVAEDETRGFTGTRTATSADRHGRVRPLRRRRAR